MYQNLVADKDLGYVKSGPVNAATSIASLFPGGVLPRGTALITVIPEVDPVRWRSDGVAPTNTVGYPLAIGAELRYTAAQASQLQFISQAAGALLNVYAFGYTGSAS